MAICVRPCKGPQQPSPPGVEEEMAKAEFVLCELLEVAVHLDYRDEIGRRKISAVLREWLFGFVRT